MVIGRAIDLGCVALAILLGMALLSHDRTNALFARWAQIVRGLHV